MGARTAVDRYTALLQQFAKQARCEIRWIVDGQRLAEAGIILRNVAPEGQYDWSPARD